MSDAATLAQLMAPHCADDLGKLSAWRRRAPERFFHVHTCGRWSRTTVTLSEVRADGRYEASFDGMAEALAAIGSGAIEWQPVAALPPIPAHALSSVWAARRYNAKPSS